MLQLVYIFNCEVTLKRPFSTSLRTTGNHGNLASFHVCHIRTYIIFICVTNTFHSHVVELLRIVSSSLLQANPLEEQATDLMLKVQQNQENTFTLIQRHMSNMVRNLTFVTDRAAWNMLTCMCAQCVEGGTVVIELSNSEEKKDVAGRSSVTFPV